MDRLLKADVTKISHTAIREQLEGLIADYQSAEDIPIFESEQHENIEKLVKFIEKVAPEALDGSDDDQQRELGKYASILQKHYEQLAVLATQYEAETDQRLTDFFSKTLKTLKGILKKKDGEIPKLVNRLGII